MIRLAAAAAVLLAALACEEPFRFPNPVSSVRILPDTATVDEGDTLRFTVAIEDSAGHPVDRPVTWATSDARVATVSRQGTLTGLAGGYVVITATVDDIVDSAGVVVRPAIASVTIALGDQEIVVGGLLRYLAVPRDSVGAAIPGQTVLWTVADSSIARLTPMPPFAVVTGRAPGTTALTAAVNDVRRTVTITVSEVTFARVFAAESDHTCALTADGRAYCWGNDQVGQLGNGTAGASAAPSRVRGGLAFDALSPGGRFTCAATPLDEPYCWGHGASGRLGTGSLDNSPVPVPVAAAGLHQIASGWSHSCGLEPGGQPSCWGNFGALGTDTTKYSATPLAVGRELEFHSIAVGDGFSCALAGDGTARCWGQNRDGRLGTTAVEYTDEPVAAADGLVFDTIAAGPWHACGLTPSGAVHCWGANQAGQLGDGTTLGSAAPVAAAPGLAFTALSVGNAFTCGLTADGTAYCWGANSSSQLANPPSGEKCGGVFCSRAPIMVSGGLSFTSVSAGGAHACGVAGDGRVYCWGANGAGQLGDGTAFERSAPVLVLGQP